MTDREYKPIRDNVWIGINRHTLGISTSEPEASLRIGVFSSVFGKYVQFQLDERQRDAEGVTRPNTPEERTVYTFRVGRTISFLKQSYRTTRPLFYGGEEGDLEYRQKIINDRKSLEEREIFIRIIANELDKVDLTKTFSSLSLVHIDGALSQLGIQLDQLRDLDSAGITHEPMSHVAVRPAPPGR